MSNTFLDKIDNTFAELKDYLLKEFGEHMSIHNVVSDVKMQVLSHAAEHFGEVGNENPAPVKVAENYTNSSSQQSTDTPS